MSYTRFAAVIGAAVTLLVAAPVTSAPQQGLITQKVLSLDMALSMAQGALAKCRSSNYQVTVTVLDSDGIVRAIARDDGASVMTVDGSRRKAYTALVFQRPSAETAEGWRKAGFVPRVEGIIALPGGLPIKAGDEVVGAIGVSGSPGGDKDVACAEAGIAKVASQLK
jgi:uncharacterized protein GlcG (DUF336 family)